MGSSAEADLSQRELAQAHAYREQGLEGKARVCARRAAGWAVRPVYRRAVRQEPPASVISLLHWLGEWPEAPESLQQAARRLTVAVTPDHSLPHPQDPLDDARRILSACQADEGILE